MPDFWTHLIAGEEIKAAIKEPQLNSLLNSKDQLFNFACQGADPFFYNDFWPWIKNKRGPQKGDLIHSASGRKLFAPILITFKKEGVYSKNKLPESEFWQHNLVYLLGFISHYVLDRECHPYVIQNGGEGEKHKLIEASLDIYIMQQQWSKKPEDINPLAYYELKETYKENLNYFYQLIFNDFLKTELPQNLFWESYLDLRKYHKVFSGSKIKKYYFFKLINFFLPQDLAQHSYALNQKREIWPKKNYQEFEKHFKRGIKSAQKLIAATLKYFCSKISLTELLNLYGSKNFVGEK